MKCNACLLQVRNGEKKMKNKNQVQCIAKLNIALRASLTMHNANAASFHCQCLCLERKKTEKSNKTQNHVDLSGKIGVSKSLSGGVLCQDAGGGPMRP